MIRPRLLSIIGVFALVITGTLGGHPGGLDANGGHSDGKTGEYHYHRGPNAGQTVQTTESSSPRAAVLEPTPVPSARKQSGPSGQSAIDVYFSPKGGCTDAICREIAAARKRVRLQAYSFTSQPIAKALIDAKKRGVEIVAVLDKCNRTDKYSGATFLQNQGAKVVIDASHAIAHNKVMLIDDDVVITGSFNFSKAAEDSNAENLLILRGHPDVFSRYAANFAMHYEHSQPYEGVAR